MKFEQSPKNEKKQTCDKWLRISKKLFGIDTEFSIFNAEKPFKVNMDCDKKDFKFGISTDTAIGILLINGLAGMKKFWPEGLEKFRKAYNEREREKAK